LEQLEEFSIEMTETIKDQQEAMSVISQLVQKRDDNSNKTATAKKNDIQEANKLHDNENNVASTFETKNQQIKRLVQQNIEKQRKIEQLKKLFMETNESKVVDKDFGRTEKLTLMQNRTKCQLVQEFEEKNKEANNERKRVHGLNNAEETNEQQATIELTEVCQQVYEDLESEELNAASNMITTTAEIHSHDDQAAASLDDNTNSTSRKPQSCVFKGSLEDITMIE